jgi:hypothetical protein
MTPEERDAVLEEAAAEVEKMVDQHPHWTDDEHDGLLLAAMHIRGMTRKGAEENAKAFAHLTTFYDSSTAARSQSGQGENNA